MDKRKEITDVVFKHIRACSPCYLKGVEINGSDKLMGQLFHDGDDASDVVAGAERDLNIKVPLKLWPNVYTVDDMINLLLKHSLD